MDITSAPSRAIDLINRTVKTGLSNPWAKSAAASTVANAGDAPPAISISPQAQDILSSYSLDHISPAEFTEMVQRLQDAKAITPADAKELGQIRQALDAAGMNPDEPIDLADFLKQQLASSGKPAQELTTVQRQLAWVQTLTKAQSEAGYERLDALA